MWIARLVQGNEVLPRFHALFCYDSSICAYVSLHGSLIFSGGTGSSSLSIVGPRRSLHAWPYVHVPATT